jgi:hypothetical protein
VCILYDLLSVHDILYLHVGAFMLTCGILSLYVLNCLVKAASP